MSLSVNDPEKMAIVAEDVELIVVDFGGVIDAIRSVVGNGREMDGEVVGQLFYVGRQMNRATRVIGDFPAAAIIDAGFGAFEASVDQVFVGIGGVLDHKGFVCIVHDFVVCRIVMHDIRSVVI